MTNEKTNPMPYRAADAAAMPAAAGAAEAAGPDMAAPVITPDDVARGTELLTGTRTASARSRRASSPTSSGTACGTGSICATAGASRAATW